MKRNIATALLIAAAAGAAFAESPLNDETPFVSTRARAEVLAELQTYREAGVNPWSQFYNPLASFKSQTSREQVVAGYLANRDEVAARDSEDGGAAWLAQRTLPHTGKGTRLAGQPANAH